ncbi:MAG TPA: PAS domain-containing protein, partial [Prosthecobacter sp.]
MSEDSSESEQEARTRRAGREYQDVKRQGQATRAQAAEIRSSLLETWQHMLQTREGVFVDRNTRRAALNLMEDVAHARRAEQRAAAERQRAEVEVRASQIKYRNLFDSIDEGFCILEVMFENGQACDYRFREANPAFEKQTGLANVIGRTIREIAPEQAADERLAIYGRVALTGEAQRFEHSAGLAGRAYDIYAFRVDEGGRHRVAVLYNDITDRKRREVNLAFLAEIAADLSRLSSAEEIMQAVGARVGAFLRITSCNFVDVNEARDELRLVHGWN